MNFEQTLKAITNNLFFQIDKNETVNFMEKVFLIKKKMRNKIPAVTHIDGTGRLQTVEKTTNPKFYDLIKEFLNGFEKKEWYKILSKRKTFLIKGNKNIFCQNKIPMPNTFIKKYKNLMF